MAGFHLNIPTAEKGLFQNSAVNISDGLTRSFQLAVAELAFNIKKQGDVDISTAGNFSGRWTRAFTVRTTPLVTTTSDKYTIDVFFTIPYAHIHEFGGVIKPKGGLGSLFGPPMLWIPLSFANVPKSGGENAGLMTAQEYGLSVSSLFRVNRRGKSPLLLDIKSRKPIYFGLSQSVIPKRFHIREICKRNVDAFQAQFHSVVVTQMR